MSRSNKPLDEEVLKSIEKFFSFHLPNQYRNFILSENGGETLKNIFFFKNSLDDGSILDRLFGIVPTDHENLLLYIKNFKDRIPSNLIPIASDPGGNLILISVKNSDRGKIYFWDHEMEADEGETPDYSNLTLIADSFDDFINNLKSADEIS